jgi:rhomboid protease GluP
LSFSPRQRRKLDEFREKMKGIFGGEPTQPRPSLCPSCRTLVGAGAKRCHQCGANLTFSMAAASRSLGRWMPGTSPVTYGILALSCGMYTLSLLWTVHASGIQASGGGLSGLLNFGGINGLILARLGASFPSPGDFEQPWRLVTAIFLHASILHIFFNMWVLMDIGPQIEELYGSGRYLFVYVVTGIAGYLVSSVFGQHLSVGGSGALLGLIGLLLAMSTGRRGAGMQMLRKQLITWIIYIAIWGFLFAGTDNMAHLGGFASGFVLGKFMTDRAPSTPEQRKHAYALGWAAALAIAASFAMIILGNLRSS